MASEVSTTPADQDLRRTVEELKRELAEARQQQSATNTVLRVISSSPTESRHVFETIASSAAHLCEGFDVIVLRVDGQLLRLVAHYGLMPAGDVALHHGTLGGRTVIERRLFHIRDLQVEVDEFPEGSAIARERGHRTTLSVPLLKEGVAIGNIQVRRNEVRPFSAAQISLLQTFADQAVIAIENTLLFEEVKARTTELQEALSQQAGTADVLKTISRSAFDLQKVLDALTEAAARLCGADKGLIRRRDGERYVLASTYGFSDEFREWVAPTVLAAGRGSIVGQVALDRKTVHIPDVFAEPDWESGDWQRLGAFRTMVGVPLLRDGDILGILVLHRTQAVPFTEKQIELVETFADQAVIAIENTRLFEVVQARTRELQEALDYQTATSDVLEIISRTPIDLQPVLAAICETVAKLCETKDAEIFIRDGDRLRLGWVQGPIGTEAETWPITRGLVMGRAVLNRELIQVHDLRAAGEEYPEGYQSSLLVGHRTIIAVPLMRKGEAVGVLTLRRPEVKPFTDKQIALLRTFADQAVIAIENTRLFEEVQARTRELTEALEQQTATGEILNVISRSPTMLQPVLDALVKSATRYCNADDVLILRLDGDRLVAVAHYGPLPGDIGLVVPVTRGTLLGRAVLERRVVHVENLQAEIEEFPEGSAIARMVGYTRATLGVPLVRDGLPLGAIVLRRKEATLFTNKQIELLKTFADQAVIAIENTRLFEAEQVSKRELQESLEYQTATSEVLSVISRSKFELQPVLDTLVESAVRLCQAERGFIWRLRGNVFQFAAGNKMSPEVAKFALEHPPALDRSTGAGRSVLERRTIHIRDVRDDPEYSWHGGQGERIGQYRTVLGVPLLRDGEPFGAFALLRGAPKPFSDKQIELVTTFADQVVIAIENTRLFEEVQARTRELAKTVEDLEIASQHKSQFVANMSHELRTPLAAILGYAEVAKSLPIGLGDEQRLTQVLLNLVGNAIKFTDTGEVRVKAKAVNGRFAVSVADTGPGIPSDHQTRIFEQFHQVDSSNTKAKGGTGLGLAITKQIIEMHGGRIWVESTVGKGSTFQMEIPTRAATR